MNRADAVLLSLTDAALNKRPPVDPELTTEQWIALLRRAEAQKILPLILDASISLPSCRSAIRGWRQQQSSCEAELQWKDHALEQVARQAVQENEFLNLVLGLRERGLEPVVLKGPVLRDLWPRPLLRPSVDDDVLVPEAQIMDFHRAFLELGLRPDDPEADPRQCQELGYHKPGSPLYVELHRCLFDPDSEFFAAFNEPFAEALGRSVPIQVQDVRLQTLAPTDHLLFLILHAFKHFLHSGIGLRVGADICLFARHYAEELDLEYIKNQCAAFRCLRFAAALFRVGEKQLGIPAPGVFAEVESDETALLEDMLDAGLYGEAIDRLHSANITLAAAARGKGETSRAGGLKSSLLLPASRLSGRYPWLKKRPWLLPAAWAARGADYLLGRKKYGRQSPAASLRIGRERVRLLERYGIIDENR
ncbi:MAG: nucleotidyltransferase family protein [Oscillospiraceae bacterium]|nr:nucleotidyltransferase family protein [Oscillospiraceae bacterium]